MVRDKALSDLIRKIKAYNPHADIELIGSAYKIAKFAHSGQFRKSGESYLDHPVAVANILADLKSDTISICAALLHDVIEDTSTSIHDIRQHFGDEIAALVESLTKLEKFSFDDTEEYTAENLRKMLLASAKDVRVIIIKLADRLHNMQTLKYLDSEKQKRISSQTMHIFAPIAEKLGMFEMKGQLEDLAFRYLDPVSYQEIKKRINRKRAEREIETKKIISLLTKRLKDKGIDADVFGRAKYFYSIYKKMVRKNKDVEEIYDLIGLRIIVKTIPESYGALGVVHELWRPEPGRFKDYISLPKANGYQSLHTSVIGEHGRFIEVQIRTDEMQILAEDGVAAHWKYKDTERDKKFEKKIQWLKQILEWKQYSENAKEFVDTLKVDLFSNEIVVFTPKGDPISLPVHSTPVDFAFMVHTNIGTRCVGAKVNGKVVPLDTPLRSADIIEILTSKKAEPSRQWLNFVVTNKAKSKIKAHLQIKTDHNPKQARLKSQEKNTRVSEVALRSLVECPDKKHDMKLSKCCSPKPGQPIVASLTKDKIITIHTINCPNAYLLDQNERMDVRWKTTKPVGVLQIVVQDQIGVLTRILNGLSRYHLRMLSITTEPKKQHVVIRIEYEKEEQKDMQALTLAINKLPFVISSKADK